MNKLCVFLFMSFLSIGKMYSTDYNGRKIVKLCENHGCYTSSDIYWSSDFLNEVSTYSAIDEVNYYNNGQWHRLDDTGDPICVSMIAQNVFTVQFINRRLGQNHYYYSTVHIIRADEEHFNLPQNICVGNYIDLHDYTSITHFGAFSTNSSPMYITGASNDELHIPSSAIPNTYNVTWTIHKEGTFHNCTFNYDKNIEIREKPVITWLNQFPTSTQILDSETTPITLNGTSTAGGVMTYNGPGVSNGAITPSNAGYGTHTLTAYSTTQYGCKDTTTQTIEITHDAGIPGAPQIRPPSSGVITSQDFYSSYIIPTGYAPNQPYSQEYSEMHVCDGQQITISIGNPTLLSIDSVRYIYNNNGNYDTIGTYPTNNSTITYTIPETGSARIDYIISEFKTNLGLYGSSGNTSVFVTAVEPTTPLSTLICGNEFIFYIVEEDQGVRYEPFLRPYNNGTLNGGNDWIYNENTYITRLTDLNNNNLHTTQSYGYGVYTLTAPKSKTIARTVITKVPYDEYGTNDVYSLVSNPQTCKFTDSITISRKPIVDFNYTGDSIIIGGTTVTISNNSLLSDYTTFDFFNTKGAQIGDTITDTLFVPQGNVLITANDNFGCSSDTLIQLVTTTNNPGLGLLDEITSGLIYPTLNNLVSFSGLTDSNSNEMHICDGQEINLILDISKLKFSNGIDSVKYTYFENGNLHNVGKYHILDQVNYSIPKTNSKRVDTLYTQLFTVLDSAGFKAKTPIYVSYALQREPSSQILNCDEDLNYTNFIGQNSTDFVGLINWSHQGNNADFTTFNTEFYDVNGNIQFHSGISYNYSLPNGVKVDTIFKREITNLPFKNNNNNNYYNAISNPQSCILNDTIIVVRPPIASYTFIGQNIIEAGTPVKHISTSQYNDSVTWDFHDGSYIYDGDIVWHYIYDIGFNDVTITAYDDYGCSDTLTDFGYIEVVDWTGIENIEGISSITSYPNPFINEIFFEFESTEISDLNLRIFNLNGQEVHQENFTIETGKNTKIIQLDNISNGIYNCQIIGSNFNITKQIIKK